MRHGAPPPSCLVVDDSALVRQVARRILEGRGYRVVEAEDGIRALAACRARLPDAILLDWNMPGMNGLDCLLALRAEFGPDLPSVLFCTIENDLGFVERAIAAGAREFIMKPFDAALLGGKLEQAGLP